MLIAIVVVPVAGIYNAGGLTNVSSSIKALNPELLNPFTTTDGKTISFIAITSLLAWGLGYFGQPHILARFMAIKSSGQIARARRIAMSWVVISLSCAVIVGLVGIAALKSPLATGAHETIFMVMVDSFIPHILAGVFLAAILAAIMSTADSQLLVTSSALTEDFYHVLFRKNASEKELVWISRFAVVAVSILAFIFAMNPESSVLGLVAYAWGGFGATFGPIIILSLFWRRMTRNGALGGIICGGITVLVWKHLSGGIFDMYEIVPGFIISIIAIVVISFIGSEPSKEIVQEFESVSISDI
jgi:sodium/proline symporter